LVVKERVQSSQFYRYGDQSDGRYWVDPTSPVFKESQLGLYFHSFTGDDGDSITMA
jgi:hypothetical protein